MNTRLRLLKGANALLYFGPLLAGLGGFGWPVVLLFGVIFMGWLFILRPQQWPRTLADWGRPEALISLLTQGVVQVLLVAFSFGIGRGIGGVLGAIPPFPLMLPVAISFLSIPFARMIWDPWQDNQMDVLLDDALAKLDMDPEGEDTALPEDLKRRVATASRLVMELSKLLENTVPAVLEQHLAAMATQVGHDALRVALMDRVYDWSANALLRKAAVVHSTMGAAVDQLAGAGYPLAMFRETRTPDLMALFASRAANLLTHRGALSADFPDPAQVRAIAEETPLAADALEALAAKIEAL